jgi:hypothetical protein
MALPHWLSGFLHGGMEVACECSSRLNHSYLRHQAPLSLPKTLSTDSRSPTNQNMIVEWLQSASC